MRFKALVAKSLLIALPLTLIPTLAIAAAKVTPGSKCKVQKQKVIYQDKSFTCIKSGKKLIWNKGAVTLLPSPTPSSRHSVAPATTSFTPWASSFDTQIMTSAALASTSLFLGNVKPSSDYKLTIDPAIKDSDRAWITKMLDYTNGAFSEILRGQVKVFLGTTHDWSAKALRNAGEWVGDPQSPYPCSNGKNDAYCAGPNLTLLIYSDIYTPNSNYQWDAGRRSTPAHELFHNVQFALGGRNVGSNDPTHIPRWLMEGSANYFGFYIVDKLGFDNYGYGRYQQVNSNQSYKTVVPLVQYDNFTSDPYGIGQAATEYLVASVGFERFLNIWAFTKSENDFSKGFKKAIGIDISDFYSKFEAARPSMSIGTS
jgi:hypothetical protein